MHRRIARRGVAALVLTASTAACSGGSGTSLVPSRSAGSTAANSTSAPIASKGVDPDTIAPAPSTTTPASSAPLTRTTTPPRGLRDFRDVTFAVPNGFQVSTDYSPLTPLESDYTSHYVVPTDPTNTKEVIGMHVYALPKARTVTTRTNQLALIKSYNAEAKAVVSSTGIRKAPTAIDGVPAYTETATEPGDHTYVAYWAFGTRHFLQFSCQLGSSGGVSTLAVACGTTLASLQLT